MDHGTYAEGSLKYNLVRFMETRICRQVDHVAVLCNGLKQDLIKRGIPAEKPTPVFNGINPADSKLCKGKNGLFVTIHGEKQRRFIVIFTAGC